MRTFWFPALIILISILNLGQSLHFAINGDDWLALYRYNLDFGNFLSHLDIKNYTTPTSNYVFGYLIMGLISQLFAYDALPYYLVALIFRIAAAFSFYFSIYAISKNRWMGYLSAIFFASLYAGIETTNWVSNMNTYLSIIFLNIFLKLFYDVKTTNISLKTILQSMILLASFLVTPVRMHGLLFFIPAVIFFKFERLNKNNIAKFSIFLLAFLIPIILARILTFPNSNSDYQRIVSPESGNKLSFLFSLIANTGLSIFPNILINQTNISSNLYFIIGAAAMLLLSVYFFLLRHNNPSFFKTGILSLISSISFLVIPGLINPSSVLSSDHRYLIIPASYMLIAFSVFVVSLFHRKNSILKNLSVLLILLIILINSIALQKYFFILSKEGRLETDSKRIFTYINSKIIDSNDKIPLVFLFLSNDNFFIYNAVNFGFTPHMMVLNPRFAQNPEQAPFAVDNIDSLKSILKDPNSPELQRYGYKPVKIPIENIYSFYIDSERIEDLSDQIRDTLNNI